MKISLKIEPETLFLLHAIVRNVTQYTSTDKAEKSMDLEIFEILTKRCFSYQMNPNGKKRSLSLRFHLAQRLFILAIDGMVNFRFGSSEWNKLEMFKIQLHQKLL